MGTVRDYQDKAKRFWLTLKHVAGLRRAFGELAKYLPEDESAPVWDAYRRAALLRRRARWFMVLDVASFLLFLLLLFSNLPPHSSHTLVIVRAIVMVALWLLSSASTRLAMSSFKGMSAAIKELKVYIEASGA